MNGPTRIVLDTNAAISFLRGEPTAVAALASMPVVFMSVISVLEYRVGGRPSHEEAEHFNDLVRRITVVPVTVEDKLLLERIISVRQSTRLKLPDAIIAATALERSAVLVTQDQHFTRIPGLQTLDF